MKLSIAYVTSRRDPKIEWFFDSLHNQVKAIGGEPPYIIVIAPHWEVAAKAKTNGFSCKFHPPKASVWQGEYRLTKEDWFAASNTRNTALCLAPDGYLAYVDDLSVLMPRWLAAVHEHMAAGRFGFGAYIKAKNLKIVDGAVSSYDVHSLDNRYRQVQTDVTPCGGRWLYGCSLCGPVESFLHVGGWPEFCDGLGFEDVIMGYALQNAGFPLFYDRRMLTVESEEDHHREPAFKRSDYGQSPNDKSHSALNIGIQSRYFENYYEGGIRKMREEVLAGKPFPITGNPRHEWYTGTPLAEL